jgi:hypothetical protein
MDAIAQKLHSLRRPPPMRHLSIIVIGINFFLFLFALIAVGDTNVRDL